MRQAHVYLCPYLVVEGTPVGKEEYEELTGRKVGRSESDVYFLRDVTVLGSGGPMVEVATMILEMRTVSGVGRGDIRVVSRQERSPQLGE